MNSDSSFGPADIEQPQSGRLRVCYISRSQFGHMVPTYYNCLYLARLCDLSIVTLDKRLPRYSVPGAALQYAVHRPTFPARWISLVSAAVRASRPPVNVTIIEHFTGCGLIPLLSRRVPCIVDIRTGSVARRRVHRALADNVMRLDARAFSHVSVISASLRDRLGFPMGTTHVVPLGAVVRQGAELSFDDGLRLLYVGTLSGRRLADTLRGLALFIARNPDVPILGFDIIGSGLGNEAAELSSLAMRLGLANITTFHGFIHQVHLDRFYEEANVGVAYVPQTDYYDVQPPTKTFEYLLAGLPVIATSTREHHGIINDHNGVLIGDSAESFCGGLQTIWVRRASWRSASIRGTVRDYSWQTIVDTCLWPLIREVATRGATAPTRRLPLD